MKNYTYKTYNPGDKELGEIDSKIDLKFLQNLMENLDCFKDERFTFSPPKIIPESLGVGVAFGVIEKVDDKFYLRYNMEIKPI